MLAFSLEPSFYGCMSHARTASSVPPSAPNPIDGALDKRVRIQLLLINPRRISSLDHFQWWEIHQLVNYKTHPQNKGLAAYRETGTAGKENYR